MPATPETIEDVDLRPFAVDFDKYRTIALGEDDGRSALIRMILLNTDFRVVACLRFTQASRKWRAQHRVLGVAPTAVAALWRRRTSSVHHFTVDSRARIGPGFFAMHHHGILIGPVTIGDNCVIHHNVTIGQRIAKGDHGVPRIGDDVWIGPGATITGDITVGDGATISAGAVVSKNIPARALVAGNPGRVIATDYDNSAMLNYRVRRPAPEAAPTPDSERVDRALAEYARLRDPQGDRQLEAIKAAIFLEDVFDVVLREEQIDPDLLGTADGMRAVLARAGRVS